MYERDREEFDTQHVDKEFVVLTRAETPQPEDKFFGNVILDEDNMLGVFTVTHEDHGYIELVGSDRDGHDVAIDLNEDEAVKLAAKLNWAAASLTEALVGTHSCEDCAHLE